MDGEPVIPAPLDDDDDDVAWALQTAAVQWQRGQHADAVVWVRRAVDAAIASGNASRTNYLTRLASAVAERVVIEMTRAEASSPSGAPPDVTDVDGLLDAPPQSPPERGPRKSSHTLTGEIPFEFDGEMADADVDDDDAATIPPPARDEFHSVAPDELFSNRPPPGSIRDRPLPSFADGVPSLDTEEPFSGIPVAPREEAFSVQPEELWNGEPPSMRERSDDVPLDDSGSLPAFPAVEDPSFDGPTERLDAGEPPRSDPDEEGMPAVLGRLPGAVLRSEPALELDPEKEGPPVVDGVALDGVRGFEDLPEDVQSDLARRAMLTTLSADEEVGSFGAALVTRGRVGLMPSIADVAASVATPGEIVFTRGTLEEGIALRVVALEDDTVVASWSTEDLDRALSDCPWVADELRLVADRFQALAGATLGLLGERLDDALRGLVLSRLDVKAFEPGETIVQGGKPVPGLHVVGAGRVELTENGRAPDDLGPGAILFAEEVLGAGPAHATARAGKTGAVLLVAPRSVAHELLLSVPPLIEILAG